MMMTTRQLKIMENEWRSEVDAALWAWEDELAAQKELPRRLADVLAYYRWWLDAPKLLRAARKTEREWQHRAVIGKREERWLWELALELQQPMLRQLELTAGRGKKNRKQTVDIAAIKAKWRVADIIGRTAIYKSATVSKYLCPLHNEKTASFTVYHREYGDRWHCFGACDTGGDVIDLYRALHDCDFKTAITNLDV